MLVQLDDVECALDSHSRDSTMRERIIEHVFVADLLRALRRRGITTAEVLRPEFDAGGYDLVISLEDVVRHVQLKSTLRGGKAARVTVNRKLADKPSGCVIWFTVSTELQLEEYFWFGGSPGMKLPSIETLGVAKHTKGNSLGVKSDRPNHRVLPRGMFEKLTDFDHLLERLLGPLTSNKAADASPSLDELVARITPENRHPETDWGPDVGKERWWEER